METIKKGSYRFNDELAFIRTGTPCVFNFTSNNTTFEGIAFNGLSATSWGVIYANDIETEELTPAYAISYGGLDGGWQNTNYQHITIPTDTEVDDTFATWFEANTEPIGAEATPAVEITYKGEPLTTLDVGDIVTLCTNERKLEGDLVIKANGGRGGSCTGTHIVDVDKLPEKGVEGTVYRVEETRLTEFGRRAESGEIVPTLWVYALLLNAEPNVYNVNSLDDVKEPQHLETFSFYFVMPEKMLYVWLEDEGGNLGWHSVPDGAPFLGEGEELYYITKQEHTYYEWVSEEFHNIIFEVEGTVISIASLLTGLGIEHSFNIIPTETTEGIKVSVNTDSITDDTALHFYYIEDKNGIYLYKDNGTGEYEWVLYDADITFDGFVIDEGDVVTDGCYAVGGYPGWKKYLKPSGQITVTQNNTNIDVRNFSRAKIKATEYGGKVVYE